jgi:hypothetical protein
MSGFFISNITLSKCVFLLKSFTKKMDKTWFVVAIEFINMLKCNSGVFVIMKCKVQIQGDKLFRL